MTAALPNPAPRPPAELAALERAWAPPRGWRILSAVNKTHIGVFYIATALIFFVCLRLGLLIRPSWPCGSDALSPRCLQPVLRCMAPCCCSCSRSVFGPSRSICLAGHANRAATLPFLAPVAIVLGYRSCGCRLRNDLFGAATRRRLGYDPR